MATEAIQQEALFTREAAARYLGVKPATLATWSCTRKYRLKYIKVGSLVRYRLEDLNAFLAARTVDSAPPVKPTRKAKRKATT